MNKDLTFESPDGWALTYIANNLRMADYEEIKAARGIHPELAIKESIERSYTCKVVFLGDEPIAVVGLAIVGDVGIPWMVGTDTLRTIPLTVIKTARHVINNFLKVTPKLCNMVDVRNTDAIKFLHYLGFEFGETTTACVHAKLPFVRFYKEKPCVTR